MTDLHTHILPGMDDGAANLEESLAMLRMEQEQGVDTIVLTSHFYRDNETADQYLSRRQEAYEILQAGLPADAPRLILGAEVKWYRGLAEESRLSELCIGQSGYMLLEMPMREWSAGLLERVYQFSCTTGIAPVLAHVERYLSLQKNGQFKTLLQMGFPMQISSGELTKPFRRGRALQLLKRGTWVIGSDCHNTDSRPPSLGAAAAYMKKHLSFAEDILSWQPQ